MRFMYGAAVVGALNFKQAPQYIPNKMLHIKEISNIYISNGFMIGCVADIGFERSHAITYGITFRRVHATTVVVEKQ
jgi:hypothetical protein